MEVEIIGKLIDTMEKIMDDGISGIEVSLEDSELIVNHKIIEVEEVIQGIDMVDDREIILVDAGILVHI